MVQTHSQKHKDEFLMAAEMALKSNYMDDSMSDEKQSTQLYKELDKLWALATMRTQK